jgi:hypothetical protein
VAVLAGLDTAYESKQHANHANHDDVNWAGRAAAARYGGEPGVFNIMSAHVCMARRVVWRFARRSIVAMPLAVGTKLGPYESLARRPSAPTRTRRWTSSASTRARPTIAPSVQTNAWERLPPISPDGRFARGSSEEPRPTMLFVRDAPHGLDGERRIGHIGGA